MTTYIRGAKRAVQMALAAALASASSSCTSMPSGPACDTTASLREHYTFSVADRVLLTVFRQPDMSGEFIIESDGALAIPLVGRVPAVGLNVERLTARISSTITEAGLLQNPAVSLSVIEAGEVYILGEVNAPSPVPYTHKMKVVHVLTDAGGPTYRGNLDGIRVKRGDCWLDNAQFDTELMPGDVVIVAERFF